jgi:hypothetical protein
MTKPTKTSPVASRKEINAVKSKMAGIARKRDAEKQARAEIKAEKKTKTLTAFRKGVGSLKALKSNAPLRAKPKGKK